MQVARQALRARICRSSECWAGAPRTEIASFDNLWYSKFDYGFISEQYITHSGGYHLIVRMTKKLQKSLGIPCLQDLHSPQKPAFLDEWYMNIFNIRKKWYFIFLEAKTFYTIIQPFYFIQGSDEFSTYFPRLLGKRNE